MPLLRLRSIPAFRQAFALVTQLCECPDREKRGHAFLNSGQCHMPDDLFSPVPGTARFFARGVPERRGRAICAVKGVTS